MKPTLSYEYSTTVLDLDLVHCIRSMQHNMQGARPRRFMHTARQTAVSSALPVTRLMVLKYHRRGLLLLVLNVELGWWSHSPASADESSGGVACTDSAATNFKRRAVLDDGSCVYTETHLRQQERKVLATCHIFDNGAWPAALTGGADAHRAIAAPAGRTWIVQGKPLRGRRASAYNTQPLVQPLAYRFTASLGADITLRYVLITDSAGIFGSQPKGAGLWLSGGVGTLTAVAFDQSITSSRGGAIYAGESSTLSVTMGVFEQTSAQFGGAIYASLSTLTVSRSTFRATRAQTHGGGAIYADKCPNVTISESRFDGCTAEDEKGGMALFLQGCSQILISGSSFTPFDQTKTVYFDTSWLSTVGGCGEHPCATGHSCTYAQYSRNCTACPASTFSTDGIICLPCAAGQGPNRDKTQCESCTSAKFSTDGQCQTCAAPNVVDANHRTCTSCPPGKEPNPAYDDCTMCSEGKFS
eukprot:COSAG01_NODE_10091_length_2252_cov_3.104041_1_plen_470_part_10